MDRLLGQVGAAGRVQIRAGGEPQRSTHQHPHPDPARCRRRHRFQRPAPRLHRPVGERLEVGLGLVGAGRPGPGHHVRAEVDGALIERHAVPPTISSATRSVGCPTPTGTYWPCLPQLPSPGSSAKSSAIASTRASTANELPASVAPRTGAPSRPSSIRYPSATLTPNCPLVVPTR